MRRLLLVDKYVLVGLIHRSEAARAGADDRGCALAVLQGDFKARLQERLVSRGGGILRIAVGQKYGFGFAMDFGIEIADLGPNANIQVLEREALDRPYAAFALLYRGPKLFGAGADCRNHARSGNGDPAPLAVY